MLKRIALALFCAVLAFVPADAGTMLLMGGGTGAPVAAGGGGGGNTTAWNTGDNGGLTLTNSNRTATSTMMPWLAVRSVTSQSSGKLFIEFTTTTFNNNGFMLGIGDGSLNTGNYPGSTTHSYGFQCELSTGYGLKYYNAANDTTQFWEGCTTGDVIDIAIDFSLNMLWIKNITVGSGWNVGRGGTQDPATGQGGIDISGLDAGAKYIMFGAYFNPSANSVTINTSFTGTVPSGFSAWN